MSIETIRSALKAALEFVADERENREAACDFGDTGNDYVTQARRVERELAEAYQLACKLSAKQAEGQQP